MKRNLVLVLPLIALLGAGCSSTRNAASTKSAPATTVESKAAATADTGAVASAGVVGDDASADVGLPPELVNKRVIYFAFDSSEVRAEDRALVAAHARFLAGRSNVAVRLEGHTDQRGTREYNIGLGERRAQAVRAALGLQGVSDGQISTVSYGEERPAAAADDEESMAMNRRVELVYGKR